MSNKLFNYFSKLNLTRKQANELVKLHNNDTNSTGIEIIDLPFKCITLTFDNNRPYLVENENAGSILRNAFTNDIVTKIFNNLSNNKYFYLKTSPIEIHNNDFYGNITSLLHYFNDNIEYYRFDVYIPIIITPLVYTYIFDITIQKYINNIVYVHCLNYHKLAFNHNLDEQKK